MLGCIVSNCGTVQVTVSQRQRAGRTGKANNRLVKKQTPMKLGIIFIGVLFYGTVLAPLSTFLLLQNFKRAPQFPGNSHKIQLFTAYSIIVATRPEPPVRPLVLLLYPRRHFTQPSPLFLLQTGR